MLVEVYLLSFAGNILFFSSVENKLVVHRAFWLNILYYKMIIRPFAKFALKKRNCIQPVSPFCKFQSVTNVACKHVPD